MKDLTNKEYLSECVIYGKESGRFTWLKRPIQHFKSIGDYNTWNDKNAGENACIIDTLGYELIHLDGKVIKAHHAAFILTEGVKPEEVDHENGVRNDNRWCNIRSVTRLENTKNRKLRSDNPSGHPGVAYREDSGKWRARINHNGKRINLGSFSTEQAAINARIEAEKEYGYHENHGRVI